MTRKEMEALTNAQLVKLIADCAGHPFGDRAASVLADRSRK